MQMTWCYVEFKRNQLFCEDGTLYLTEFFDTEEQAEQYLNDHDLRATIK